MCRKADRETRVIASWAEQLRRKRSVFVPVLHAWMVEAFAFAMARRRPLSRLPAKSNSGCGLGVGQSQPPGGGAWPSPLLSRS